MWNFLTRFLALCALIIFAVNPGFSAEPTEKRIALVLGNAAYQAGPLQTAANDAGLIAQTLQAASFDVVGARDLDQEGLRRAFRDFLEKASASGPDTVVFIYLSGYGLQLEGENYFLPVDAKIARDTDVVAESVRISDYLRPLGSLHLKAGIVVLDMARKPPFAISGQPLAGGLALVEPPPGMLVAFNATPGTVAAEQGGAYGAYAQSLAEMMREGSLSMPALFDRVRLRVSEVTKGAQLPWSSSKTTDAFVLFERASDAPSVVSEQNATVHSRRLAELSPQDAYASALERDSLDAYEEFLSTYSDDPLAERVRAIVAVRREALTWRRTCLIDTPEAYWSYLQRYPNGSHSGDARRRLALLSAAFDPPASFAPVDYDVPPPPPAEEVYVNRPFVVFADFGFVPPPPFPVYFLPPPPPDFVVLEPPIVVSEPYVLPVPVFVPLPTWCDVPRYAVHPHENFFVSHVHDAFIPDRSARAFTIRSHAGHAGVSAPVAHGAALAASLPPSIRTRSHEPSSTAALGRNQSARPVQPLPGMAGHALPRLPGRLGTPLSQPESSAMAAVPPAGAKVHPQAPPAGGIPQLRATPPASTFPRSLPGTNGHALPTVPPVQRPTPPAQAHVPPPQAPHPPAPALANRQPPASPLRPPSPPPPAVHAPVRPPTAALSPPRPPVQSAVPQRPMIATPPRPVAPAAPPRPMVHAPPPSFRPPVAAPPRPPVAAPPRPMVQAPPPRPAPPPAAQVARPPPPAAARPAQPQKRG
jgi:uncharacterized caspase-like protein